MHVFTIELYAILMAIKWTEQLVNQKVLICIDSVSAITSIGVGTAKSHQDLIYEILMAIRSVSVRARSGDLSEVGPSSYRNLRK